MKKTFINKTSIEVLNVHHRSFLLEYAISKKVPIHIDTTPQWVDIRFPNISYIDGALADSRANKKEDPEREWITTDQWLEYCDNWVESQLKNLQLNQEYTAQINKQEKTVKVGCQTFSFSKIEELYKATLD